MSTAPRCALRRALLRTGALALVLTLALPLAAQELTPAGLWQSVSDVDGKPKALVRIHEVQGEFVGVIEQVLNPEKRDALCKDCPGERHNQPVMGLTIITGVHRDGEHFGGGQILDPDNGKVYSCKLTLVDGGKRLEVRGFLGFSLFGRSQTWLRQE
ncbi:conserved exported hypothetical protein [Burkholderiales bacterium]|nr:conserved exported hypothetical protein [Burkholderiales bacterium]